MKNTWRAVVGVWLVVLRLHVAGLLVVTLLISHVLLSIVHVSTGVKRLVAHLGGIDDHWLHGLVEHDVRASSAAEDAEDDEEDDGEDDGAHCIIDPRVVVIEVVAVVYFIKLILL
jgi:hypothetical protein